MRSYSCDQNGGLVSPIPRPDLFLMIRTLSNDDDSREYDIPMGSVRLSPSTLFKASWTEGDHLHSNMTPFRNSYLTLKTMFNRTIEARYGVELKIYPSNGIGAYCGFPSSKVYRSLNARVSTAAFTIQSTNTTNSTQSILKYDGIGAGCSHLSDCNGNGECDYCTGKCLCSDGFGSADDIVTTGRGLDGSCAASKSLSKGKMFFILIFCPLPKSQHDNPIIL